MFQPVTPRRVFEEISDQIKRLISDGHLKPGDRLPGERELAVQFGVGRMMLREALRTLEEAGIIDIRKGNGGGAFIREFNTSAATRSFATLYQFGQFNTADLTEARAWLEKTIIEHAVRRRTDEDLRLLEENVEQGLTAIRDGGVPRNVNVEFHLLLACAAKNPLFVMLIRSLLELQKDVLQELRPDLKYLPGVAKYHQAIFEAVRDQDRERATEALLEHIMDLNSCMMDLTD